jgi:hypothetical protein
MNVLDLTARQVEWLGTGETPWTDSPMVSEDLVEHDCILYAWSTFGNSWSFKGHEVGVKGRVTVNSPDGVYKGGTWHWDRQCARPDP